VRRRPREAGEASRLPLDLDEVEKFDRLVRDPAGGVFH